MKIAQYGTTLVVMHAIVHGLHGFAHKEIQFPLPASEFVCWCCGDIGSYHCSRFTLDAVVPHR
jgi:hypothetical protein